MLAELPWYGMWFLIALGILVTGHEFGHFWVARRLGVKVLRFSVGFGKPFWTRQMGQGEDSFELAFAPIPLGGYVKMLDEREGEVPQDQRHRAFNQQSLAVRSAVVVAGPVANFILAIGFFWLVLLGGETGLKPVIDSPVEGLAAEQSGFVAGDEVLAVESKPVSSWHQVVMAIFEASLDTSDVSLSVRDADGVPLQRVLHLPPDIAQMAPAKAIKAIGLRPQTPTLKPVLEKITPDSPASRAGLRSADQVLAVENEATPDWQAFVQQVSSRPGKPTRLSVRAPDGGTRTVNLVPEAIERDGKSVGRIGVTPAVPEGLWVPYEVRLEYGPLEALGEGLSRTWDNSVLLLKVFGKMLTGQASWKNVSGPGTIAEYAGKSADLGWAAFLGFLALVSISLGVINLLPVPVLDGGHLLYYLIEFVRGAPLSEKAQELGLRIGVVLVLMLMSVAIFNDIDRWLGWS